jgi:predicted phage replisome organizer
MSENKRYYFLKLKDDFFNRDEIKILESQPNGKTYSNLYLRLCLMSLKGEGRLLFRDEIPYDEQMISTVTGIELDNVRAGLVVLQRLGLIKRIESGEIYMADIQTMIGRGSTEAERLREYRRRIKLEEGEAMALQCNTDLDGKVYERTQNVPNRTPEIRVQSTEIRVQRLEKRKNICSEPKGLSASKPSVSLKILKINFSYEKDEWENITEMDLEQWRIAYPACNVEAELNRMHMWLKANPTKRKGNYRKFITNWLSRTQDKGGTKPALNKTNGLAIGQVYHQEGYTWPTK